MNVQVHKSVDDISAGEWNALAGDDPFLRHEFLAALEHSGSADAASGWQALHLSCRDASGTLLGALPLYLKSHSYGEFVFDWAWADAYHRNGLHYYPKMLCAIPFSPVSAPKLLSSDAAIQRLLLEGAREAARACSSLHIL